MRTERSRDLNRKRVAFAEPRDEADGKVAVFEDPYENRRDFTEPKACP